MSIINQKHNTYKTQPLVIYYHSANVLKVQCDPASDLNLEPGIPTRSGIINLIASFLHFFLTVTFLFLTCIHLIKQKATRKNVCKNVSCLETIALDQQAAS